MFLFGLVSRSLFAPMCDSNCRRLGLLKSGVCLECIAKNNLLQKSFLYDSGLDSLIFFGGLGAIFSDFFCLGNTFEN